MRGHRETVWCWAAVGVSVIAAAVGLASHELWRDEWQAWSLAEESTSLGDLFANVRHEGHPPLWHLILFVLSRLGPVELMRVLVAAAGVATTAVVAWFGPVRTWQKPLFALGYFSAFEYLAVSRPYALTALVVVTYAALTWSAATPHRALRSVLLVLLACTSVYGAMVALVLVGELVLRRARTDVAVGAAGIGGVALSLAIARPSSGTTGAYTDAALFHPFLGFDMVRLEGQLHQLFTALVPVPSTGGGTWWLSSVVDLSSRKVLFGGVAVAAGVVALAMWRSWTSLAMWCAGVGGLLAFGYVVYESSTYHYGHVYLVALAALWAARHRRAAVVTVVLAVHAVGGVVAVVSDARGDFSAGEAVAAAIDDGEVVAVDPDWMGATIAGEIGRPVIMLASKRRTSYVRWDDARSCRASAAPLCLEAEEVLRRATAAGADVLVVPASADLPAAGGWRRVEVFDDVATDEAFALYRRR